MTTQCGIFANSRSVRIRNEQDRSG